MARRLRVAYIWKIVTADGHKSYSHFITFNTWHNIGLIVLLSELEHFAENITVLA